MAVPDLQTGLEILSALPLADPRQAYRQLDYFLDCLLKAPPPVDVHLELLEQSRETLCFVGEELARNYVNKPLPFDEAQEGCFREVVSIWTKAAHSYACCARRGIGSPPGERADPARNALILHRCIYYIGITAIEHYRARRELPPGLWRDLHAHYALAEQCGVATIPVNDALESVARSTDCTAALLSLLLIQLAGPYGLSITDQSLVRRWAHQWSPLVTLNPVVAGEVPSQFVIDLLRDLALNLPADNPFTVHLRRLDTRRLLAQLNRMREQLRQKRPPARLGLGDYPAAQCKRLLGHLASNWSQRRGARRFSRRATSGMAGVSSGFEAIYQQLCGESPGAPQDSLAGFPQEAERRREFKATDVQGPLDAAEQPHLRVEQWVAVNQSASGFCLMRGAGGKKITHGQLLAVWAREGERVLLARTVWLMQERGDSLIVGVATLAGLPQCVAARPRMSKGVDNTACRGAFLLPAVPAVGSEQSLIIPRGWSGASRRIEIYTDTVSCVELAKLLDRGSDFERVSFVVLDHPP